MPISFSLKVDWFPIN